MITIDYTYDVVTPESAEHGDYAETGFYVPGGWRFAVGDYDRQQWLPGSLAHYIRNAQQLGIVGDDAQYGDDGASYFSVDPDIDCETGEGTSYAMHIAGITRSTARRIARLLNNH